MKACGFRCSLATRDESPAAASQREVAGWWRSLKVALLLSIPIFVAKWGAMIGPGEEFWHAGIGCHGMFTTEALVASVCGLAVQIFVGGRFYRNAYTQFRSCSWGMDALVVVATSMRPEPTRWSNILFFFFFGFSFASFTSSLFSSSSRMMILTRF